MKVINWRYAVTSFLLSFAAPSTAGFVGISPKGRGMDAVRR